MLKKRSRPFQELASDSSVACDNVVHKVRGSPFFNIPGIFLGLTTKGVDSDSSAKSPTSPLDFKISNSFVKSPRSLPIFDGQPKSWDCSRVGLGLIDSLNDESKTILLGSQLRISKTHLNNLKDDHILLTSPKSLPKNYAISSKNQLGSPKFATGCTENESKSNSDVFSLDLKNTQLGPSHLVPNFSCSLPIPASGIELSEEYTCIISHGPNPKTTHIFGDCILDSVTVRSLDDKNNVNEDTTTSSGDILGYCFSCKKKLEHGEDIYIYRGEKAFCGYNCRDQEILSEEDKSTMDAFDEIFISGMALVS